MPPYQQWRLSSMAFWKKTLETPQTQYPQPSRLLTIQQVYVITEKFSSSIQLKILSMSFSAFRPFIQLKQKIAWKEIWGSQFLKKCSLSNFSLALLDFTCTMFFTQLPNQNDNRTPMMVTEELQSMRTVLGRFECSFACRRLR